MAIFKGGKNRDETFAGTDANDRFLFDPADLTSGDVIVGGGGTGVDTLVFTAAGTISADALMNARGIEQIQLAAGTNALTLSDGFVASATGARISVVGGSGNDRVDASSLTGANAVTAAVGGGNDTLLGGAGADIFSFAQGTLTSADFINGGAGIDTVIFGDQKTSSAESLANVQAVELLRLGNVGSKIALTEELVLSADDYVHVVGGAGDDQIDISDVIRDGLQTTIYLNGGAGDDTIQNAGRKSASALYLVSVVDGGTGADTIDLIGAGSGRVTYDGGDALAAVSRGMLVVRGAATIDLSAVRDQSAGDTAIVRGFTSVDASASKANVTLTGTGGDSSSFGAESLIGGSGRDVIGNAAMISGGSGADTLIGATTVSTTFTLNEGDFVRGESILGQSGQDRLVAFGSADLTKGSVKGINTLVLSQSPAGSAASVMIGVDQVADLTYVQGGGELAIELGRRHALTLDRLYDQSFGEVRVTINGSAAADMIDAGQSSVAVTIRAGGGDDVVAGTIRSPLLDGGDGIDTLRLTGFAQASVEIDLSRIRNQGVSGTGTLLGFENVDMSNLGGDATVTVYGSEGRNELRGTSGTSALFGEGGDDILRALGDFGAITRLEGGAGEDTLYGTGENALAIMTGGRGDDTFRWIIRGAWADFDKPDTVTDFSSGHDHLSFAQRQFGFAGDAFERRVVAGGTGVNVTGADLVIYTGGKLDSIDDVVEYISAARNGGVSGFFIAGSTSAGHTVLYHTLAGEYGYSDNVTAIADLGAMKPTQLVLSDFAFI